MKTNEMVGEENQTAERKSISLTLERRGSE